MSLGAGPEKIPRSLGSSNANVVAMAYHRRLLQSKVPLYLACFLQERQLPAGISHFANPPIAEVAL